MEKFDVRVVDSKNLIDECDKLILFQVEYESYLEVIGKLFFEVSRLTTACKKQENLLQICEEKEANLKEEVNILQT